MNAFDFFTSARLALTGLDESTVTEMTYQEMTNYLRARYGVSTSFSLYNFMSGRELDKSLDAGKLPHPSRSDIDLIPGTTAVGAVYVASTIARESGFQRGQVNAHTNARGLGQWTPVTLIEIKRHAANPSVLENHLDPFTTNRSAFSGSLRALRSPQDYVDDFRLSQTMVLATSAASVKYAKTKAATKFVHPTFDSFDNVVAATIAYGRGNSELARLIVEAKRHSRQFWEFALSQLVKSRDDARTKNVAREYDRLVATICDTLPYIRII